MAPLVVGYKLSKEVRDALWGRPFGEVYPRREGPLPPSYDGRTAALRILRKYFSELIFYRPGPLDPLGRPGEPIAFQIHERDIHVEWPENEVELRGVALAFLSRGEGRYEANGLTTNVDESYADQSLILQIMSSYSEDFVVEIWAETKALRRAVIRGLESALSPLEYMAGIRFVMPDYYGQLACFSLQSKEYVDDEAGTDMRRKARMVVNLNHNVCELYPASPLQTEAQLFVDEEEGEAPAEEEETGEPGTG